MPGYIPKKGDFVVLTFDPRTGHEQKGRRPALVISNTLFNRHTGLAVVCPVTNTFRDIPFHVAVPDESSLTGYIMVEQVQSCPVSGGIMFNLNENRNYLFNRFVSLYLLLIPCCAAEISAEESWYPSKYGATDRLGAINNLSPEMVKQAAALIKSGTVYSLAMDTGPETPAFGYRNYQLLTKRISEADNDLAGPINNVTGFDDLLISWLGIGTQIDEFGHVAIDDLHYNGVPVDEVFHPHGSPVYGIHHLPPIVTRGVLLDMAGLMDRKMLDAGTVFNEPELRSAMDRQEVTVSVGDVALLHTGWMTMTDHEPENSLRTTPGLGVQGAEYLASLGVVAIGSDTWALEVLPAENPQELFPVHSALLVKHGVYILENIKTGQLAEDKVYEFFFMLAAPKFVGALQTAVHPVAIR